MTCLLIRLPPVAGAIAPAALERTAAAVAGMADEARRLGAEPVTAVGTMGLRTAANRQQFLELVRDRCGVSIEVIDGDEESRVAYLAVQSALGLADAAHTPKRKWLQEQKGGRGQGTANTRIR